VLLKYAPTIAAIGHWRAVVWFKDCYRLSVILLSMSFIFFKEEIFLLKINFNLHSISKNGSEYSSVVGIKFLRGRS